MSYRFRNILFLVFIIAFLILTTFFSLTLSGYKVSLFNILNGGSLIQKTGILALDSNPKGANIFLERKFKGIFLESDIVKKEQIKTPSKIKNLHPGEYIVRLELDSYWPWQQKINIYPGQTTFMEDLILFKKDLPISFFSCSEQAISIDSSAQKIILKEDNKIIDLQLEQPLNLGEKVDSLSFLGKEKLLINNNLIFDYFTNTYDDFLSKDLKEAEKIKIRSNNVFYIQEEKLFSYNLLSKKKEEMFSLSEKIIDYDFYNNFYFLIIRKDNNNYLKIYSYRNKELVKDIFLGNSLSYEIIAQSRGSAFVYIYDQEFKTIYVINSLSKVNPLWAVINNVKGFDFIDANNFIYFSDFEIYTFNSVLAEKNLISRIEKSIESLLWHPKNYIIYSDGRNINILDLKYDNYFLKLISLEKISNIVLNTNSSLLYFTAKIGNQEGLYKLFIQ